MFTAFNKLPVCHNSSRKPPWMILRRSLSLILSNTHFSHSVPKSDHVNISQYIPARSRNVNVTMYGIVAQSDLTLVMWWRNSCLVGFYSTIASGQRPTIHARPCPCDERHHVNGVQCTLCILVNRSCQGSDNSSSLLAYPSNLPLAFEL